MPTRSPTDAEKKTLSDRRLGEQRLFDNMRALHRRRHAELVLPPPVLTAATTTVASPHDFSDIADDGGVVDDAGEEERPRQYKLLGIWMTPDQADDDDDENVPREYWVGYRHCNRLSQIIEEERTGIFSPWAYREFMRVNNDEWLSMFPWRSVAELKALRALHADKTWMTLWTMRHDALCGGGAIERAEFERRRRVFLERHVRAMWQVTPQHYLLHVHEHRERGAFDRLCNGFIVMPAEFITDPAVMTSTLMTAENKPAYSWQTGVDGVRVIRQWRRVDRR